ncbi:MAG: beta-lactamase family protein [Hyphomonadaceae bacterium]|nr:beta-lactamase family protein [Hyphomonadaceae bacterium]
MRIAAAVLGFSMLLAACSAQTGAGSDETTLVPAAGTLPDPSPEAVAQFDPTMLGWLQDAMAKGVSDERFHNAAYVLIQDEAVVSKGYFGSRTLGGDKPVDETTLYSIYSMTKPVTGVALMILYEEGAWALDDPITRFLPELEGLSVAGEAATRAPTMQELLSHSAGFNYGPGGVTGIASGRNDIMASESSDALVQAVAEMPLLYPPGEGWSYSIASDLQGVIVERISGQSLNAFFQARIFNPLKMEDTGFYLDPETRGRLSDISRRQQASGELRKVRSNVLGQAQSGSRFESGGSGLYSTLYDYQRFARMLANGGSLEGVQILKPETVALMSSDLTPRGAKTHPTYTLPGGLGYGAGVAPVVDADRLRWGPPNGSFYWHGAAGTWFWVDPENHIVFVGLIQTMDVGAARTSQRDAMRLVYMAKRDS